MNQLNALSNRVEYCGAATSNDGATPAWRSDGPPPTKAAKRISMMHPIIEGLRSSGIDTLTGLANALNERGGMKTGQGSRWHPQTVKRIIEART